MDKSWIANGVTALNGLFGGLSMMFSLNGDFNYAAYCILLATVADAADGRTARALGTAGPLGVELDSLNDDISFGIGAGVLMYAYQLHSMGAVGMLVCALLGAFCAGRLARFNVKSSVVHGYFEGLPCPTVGVIVACYVLSGAKIWDPLALIFVLLLGFLMVSEVHYPDNKGASADQLHLPALIVSLVVVIACIWAQWSTWAAAICAGYILFGMMNTYLNNKKKKNRRLRRRRTVRHSEDEGRNI